MATTPSEGIEVNTYQDDAAKAPEVVPPHFITRNSRPSDYVNVVQQKKLPFGWSLWALLTLAAVISALVVGAGVGGGLGAKLAGCEQYALSTMVDKHDPPSHIFSSFRSKSSSAPTETATCTTGGSDDEDASTASSGYVPKLPQDIANLTQPAECAERGGPNEHTATSGLKYKFYCGMDVSAGDGTRDLVGLVAYTLSDCIDACAKMNEFVVRNKNGSNCDSLVFGWQMSNAWEAFGSNCWLKSGAVADKIAFNQPQYIYAETPE